MQKLVPMSLAPVAVIVAAAIFFLTPFRVSMLIYPLIRQAAQAKTEYETRHYAVYETEHFTVRFHDGDSEMAELVAQAAEQAYQPVSALLGHAPNKKTLIVMYPDRNELRKAFGWSGEESAMGVYWGGMIQVLSPREWMKSNLTVNEFVRSGPMVHEYTHLVFDHLTSGNYPRWFTEGLSQYAEYKINGYEWLTMQNSLTGQLHTMDELDRQFDDLDNQSLAYRESFAAVRYIAEVHGEDSLLEIIGQLRTGRKLEKAVQSVLDMSYSEYEQNWKTWAAAAMKHETINRN